MVAWSAITLMATLRSVLREWRLLRQSWDQLDALAARIKAAEKEQDSQP
jgi:hypothetical protein